MLSRMAIIQKYLHLALSWMAQVPVATVGVTEAVQANLETPAWLVMAESIRWAYQCRYSTKVVPQDLRSNVFFGMVHSGVSAVLHCGPHGLGLS